MRKLRPAIAAQTTGTSCELLARVHGGLTGVSAGGLQVDGRSGELLADRLVVGRRGRQAFGVGFGAGAWVVQAWQVAATGGGESCGEVLRAQEAG